MVSLLSREDKYQLLRDNWNDNSYKELAELTGYSPEYVRKLGGKLLLPHKKMNKQALPRESVSDQIFEDRKELHYRQQISILTKKNKTLMKQANLQEALLTVAKEQIEALPTVDVPKKHISENNITKEIANLLLSDLHGGEKIDKDEMGGLNAYDMSVMAKRLEYLAESIISIKDKMKGYDLYHLNVNMLGDQISGEIHDELREHGDGTIVEWVFNTALIVSQMLSELLTVFPTIHCTCVVGNHGRMTKKVSYKGKYVNWDYIVYQTIALMMMNNPRITFNIPKSFWTIIETGGRKQLILHGDNIRSWQGISWYGVQRATYKLMELLSSRDKYFDDIIMGHFHNLGIVSRTKGRIVLNGSVIGGNEFSVGALFASSDPYQLFYGIHPKKKRWTWDFQLELSDGDKIKKPKYEFSKSLVVADQVKELFGG